MYTRTLVFVALTLAATIAPAAQYRPGEAISVEGTVAGFHSARSFWLSVEGAKVLVYGTNAQRSRLAPGQQVRVDGTVSDDFIKLADVEVQARAIQSLGGLRSTSTAALQAP